MITVLYCTRKNLIGMKNKNQQQKDRHEPQYIIIIRQMGRKSMTWIQIRHTLIEKIPQKTTATMNFDIMRWPLYPLAFLFFPFFTNSCIHNEVQFWTASTTVSWFNQNESCFVEHFFGFFSWSIHNAHCVSSISFFEQIYFKLNRFLCDSFPKLFVCLVCIYNY